MTSIVGGNTHLTKMDLVLGYAEQFILTPYVYPDTWPETSMLRQAMSLYVITALGGYILYIFTPDQVRLEIVYTCKSVTQSKLYDSVADTRFGYIGILLSMFTFILFTDMCIYWIHRGLHHKTIYKYIHKDHHRWNVPIPFASHAFHPVDGFLQSVPYHIYPLLFPLHKVTYLSLFVFVNFWTVSIHDGDYRVPTYFRPFVNGSAHHTDHHLFYNYNYGQFFHTVGQTAWQGHSGNLVLSLATVRLK